MGSRTRLYNHIVKEVGADHASRLVSAEKMTSDFSSRRVASELVAFGVATHSVGDWGHGIGPSMAFFNPGRLKRGPQ
jgi:hypothetical protein